jgi:hypothetical protein
LVVFSPSLLVAKDVVGGRHLLKSGLGRVIARVGVRVESAGQLPVGPGDIPGRGALLDAERGVVVLLEPLALGGH